MEFGHLGFVWTEYCLFRTCLSVWYGSYRQTCSLTNIVFPYLCKRWSGDLHWCIYFSNFTFWVQRAEARLLVEDWDGAVADFKAALQHNPQVRISYNCALCNVIVLNNVMGVSILRGVHSLVFFVAGPTEKSKFCLSRIRRSYLKW